MIVFKAEFKKGRIVVTHCGEVVRTGFRWMCQAQEIAEELNKEHGYV